MATKKQPIIIKTRKPKPFDLSFTRTNENIKIITALESLKSNSGWQFLTQIFEENLKYLSNQIIEKIDGDGKPLTDSEVDIIRYKYGYLKELLNKPDEFLEKLTRTETEQEDLDPYS